jgi:AmmeMemoRadiSam system protein A
MESGVQDLLTCACGEGPILVAMRVAEELGGDTISVLRYANSADVPEGTTGRVVGYGAVMFWDYEPPAMTEERREELLGLARNTLEEYLESGETPSYRPEDPELLRYSSAFVTLTKEGELRGCIGHIRADAPLYAVVQQMAIAAATSDPRFPMMTVEELEEVEIEISVMSPFQRVVDFEEIEVGTHGLLLIMGGRQGLLLPQVPVEQGWDREEYLDNLCLKSGLPAECWGEDPTIYAFTAVVFGEE